MPSSYYTTKYRLNDSTGIMTKEVRGVSEELRCNPVEILKVKLRARKIKAPLVTSKDESGLLKNESKTLTSELDADAVEARELEKKHVQTKSDDPSAPGLMADHNGNLIRKTSKLVRDSVAILRRPGVQSSYSKVCPLKPSEILGEMFPLEEDLVDIAIAEVVTPSKLYVNLGEFKPSMTRLNDK